MNNNEYYKLVLDAFESAPGKFLLDYWEKNYLLNNTFNTNPYQNAFNSGEAEFVKKLIFIVKYGRNQLNSIEEVIVNE